MNCWTSQTVSRWTVCWRRTSPCQTQPLYWSSCTPLIMLPVVGQTSCQRSGEEFDLTCPILYLLQKKLVFSVLWVELELKWTQIFAFLFNCIDHFDRKNISFWLFSTLFFILKTKSVLNASGQCGYLQRLLWWREHCQLHTEPGLPGQCLRLCKWVITFISFIVMRIWGNKIVLKIISKCNVGLICSVNYNFFRWFCSVIWLSYFLTRFETLTHPFPIKITFAWFI